MPCLLLQACLVSHLQDTTLLVHMESERVQKENAQMSNTAQDRYDSSTDKKWQCLVCHQFVDAEMHERELDSSAPRHPKRGYRWSPVSGKIVEKWFTPISRYWNEKGVFCSAECGCEYTRAGGAAFPT